MFPFGFVKQEYTIEVSEIQKIYLKQKEDKYFGIIIKTNNNIDVELGALPNRIPALSRLNEIEEILNSCKSVHQIKIG